MSATLTAEEATPVSAMYEQEEEDADSMDWDSDVSESEDKRKTEGGVGGSNVPVEANVVVQNSPSEGKDIVKVITRIKGRDCEETWHSFKRRILKIGLFSNYSQLY